MKLKVIDSLSNYNSFCKLKIGEDIGDVVCICIQERQDRFDTMVKWCQDS